MADYKEVRGVKIRDYTTNPDNPIEGQVWYNKTDNVAKYEIPNVLTSWRTGANFNTAREQLMMFGTTSLATVCGGLTPSAQNATESWNGTSWTEVNNLNTARGGAGQAGIYNEGLVFGGQTGSNTAACENWNGSNWTEVADLNTARSASLTAAGTDTAALAAGGYTSSPSGVANTETWNGSAWTEVNDLNQSRYALANGSNAPYTSCLAYAGNQGGQILNESWNGTSWTELGDLNKARTYPGGGSSSSTSAVCFAGGNPPGHGAETETWNGSSWTETSDCNTSKNRIAGCGTGTSALSGGGQTAPEAVQSTTEELAVNAPVGAWSTSGSLNSARLDGGTAGTQTAGLIFAGGPTVVALTETYNGTSFTEVGDVNTGRALGGSFGTQTAAIIAGGYGSVPNPGSPEQTNIVEQWDGSSWTEIGDLNRSVRQLAGAGTTTSGLVFGGDPGPGAYVESWNGSAWTEVGDLNQGRTSEPLGVGADNTTAICAGGYTPGTATYTGTEIWNGSAWTEVNDLNSGRHLIAGSGTATACIGFGGFPVPATGSKNEDWNGVSWQETSDLNTARGTGGTTKGSSTLAAALGGAPTPSGSTGATENWSGTSELIKTISTD